MWGGTTAKLRELRLRRKAHSARHNRRPEFHLKRTRAEILLVESSTVISSRVLLNDMTSVGLFLYAAQPISIGQLIQLTLDLPARFFVHGKVVSCQNIAISRRIISVHNYSYRIQIEFLFKEPGDHKIVQHYCQEVLGTYLKSA